MTAQTPTSAVEALRAHIQTIDEEIRAYSPALTPEAAERQNKLLAVRRCLAALAASQEAPKAEPAFYAMPNLIENCHALASVQCRHSVVLSTEPDDLYSVPLYAAPTPPASQGDAAPAGDAVAWAEPIIEALRRCDICWGDDAGVDIGRDKLDALTAFGLLEKVGRGKWKITDAGFAAYAPGSLAAAPAPAVREAVACAICNRLTTECECWPGKLHDPADLSGLTTDERAKRFARLVVLDEAARVLHAEGYAHTTSAKVREMYRWLAALPAWIVASRTTPPTPAADGNGGAVDAEDAARYRWLRAAENELHPAWDDLIKTGVTDTEFDEIVDAARAKEQAP